jgi:ribosomal protein S18 acetylase RimI-like enzyme
MPFVLEPSWVGRRVSVRRAVGRTPAGHLEFGDVVGDLLALDAERAIVDGRDGPVEVLRAHIAAARVAPPSTADELALEAIMARGWRAPDTAELGGWLLRSAGGFTNRANSALPLRPPGRALAAALDDAHDWYAERGLPLQIQVPVEARRLLDAELAERGWAASPLVLVMAARLDARPTTADPVHAFGPAEVADVPDDGWLSRYRGGAAASTPAARMLLANHDRVGFAAVRVDGSVRAVGRGTVDDEWLGVTAIEVDPAYRRQGLASLVMATVLEWGKAHGALRAHLEVSVDNTPALALYERLGYWTHHSYHYRREPAADG